LISYPIVDTVLEMTTLEHLNAGWLHAPPNPKISCHCPLLCGRGSIALVDTGIGLRDVRDPLGRIGKHLIDAAGFQFNESDTAVRQLAARGVTPEEVTHVILTHLGPDHAGGAADFPAAEVHLASEEFDAMRAGNPRYLPIQFSHEPKWATHGPAPAVDWFGFPARRIDIGFESPILLIPLFGHTAGHCGVAARVGPGWILHVGDAYYLRGELADRDHPVGPISAAMSVDNVKRLESLDRLRTLQREHGHEVEIFRYHDVLQLTKALGGSAAA
jgi:glyoxylase-like metal-dependent hydrolase (beta-lactamase superfamily II)